MTPRAPFPSGQRGVLLLEVLIAIALFAIGVLSMIAVQAVSVAALADAQYRAEAERLVDRLITRIRMDVAHDGTTGNLVLNALGAYAHQATGDVAGCAFSGAEATSPLVEVWGREVRGVDEDEDAIAGQGLPGATANRIQVATNDAVGGLNQVTVTVCWQAPGDRAPRRHTTVAYID